MRLSSGNVYIGPYSPVKWLSKVDLLEGVRKYLSERHSFLILLDSFIEECCPLSPFTQKTITYLVSVCTSLDCMRVEFFQYLQDHLEVLPGYGFVLLALSTNLAENFDSCFRLVFIFFVCFFV